MGSLLYGDVSVMSCNFCSREKSLYIAWACFRNVIVTKMPNAKVGRSEYVFV